ncbi:MAG: hypothetical protein KAV42_06325 [Candidatus Krumholzibacteria bacterium]|nr:hypothetical protein [Candidatus Krumholzibacteria bacterium]
MDREKTELLRQIGRLVSSRRWSAARGATAVVLTFLLSAYTSLILLCRVLYGWRHMPLVAWSVFWAGAAIGAVFAAVPLAGMKRGKIRVAEEAGMISGRGNLFSAALEFSGGGHRLSGYSEYLMGETIRRAVKEMEGLDMRPLFASAGRPGWTLSAIALSFLLLTLTFADRQGTLLVLDSIADPLRGFREKPGFNLQTEPADRTIFVGDDLSVTAIKTGSMEGEVRIGWSRVEGVWQSEILEKAGTSESDGGMDTYSFAFRDIRDDLVYRFEAGREKTVEIVVSVIHSPVINRVEAILTRPSYTGLPPDTLSPLPGRIVSLEGTKVEISGEVSRAVGRGEIRFSSGSVLPLDLDGNRVTARFRLSGNDTMRIKVVDTRGLENKSPAAWPLVSLEDNIPAIDIISPADETLLPRSLVSRITYRVADDFGISVVRLRFRKEGRGGDFESRTLQAPRAILTALEEEYEWRMDEKTVYPGDRIAWYLEVLDNNQVTGPGYARTSTRVLIAPSIAQVYAESRKEEQYHNDAMEEILEESEELRDRLRDLADDLRAEGEMDWDRRRESTEILDAQKDLREKIRETVDRLDRNLESLEENRMTSMEVGRKMEEIRDLLSQIENEEFKDAMDRLRQMMEEISPDEMMSGMEQVEMDAEDIADKLERTIELLKQILMEEEMEELMRRMEEMLEDQSALMDSTGTGDLDELSDKQEELNSEYEDFEESMEEFAGENEQDEAADEIREMMENLDSAAIDSMMAAAMGQMEEGAREEASKTQCGTVSKMFSLYTKMGLCQNAMAVRPDEEAERIVEQALWDLLDISGQSEEDARLIETGNAGVELKELLERQMVTRDAVRIVTGDLLEAARKNSSVSSVVFTWLGEALGLTGEAMNALESRKFGPAALSARGVSPRLNLAIIELLRSSSSSGGGGGGAMKKMRQMLQRQSSIDEQLRQMLQQGGGSLSMEQRARMSRIAAEQRKMQELIDQIAEESRGTNELLGRLDGLGDEMEALAERLERGELDRDTIEREEKILSRMLESQRSLNRRDYSRKRVSRPGEDMVPAEADPIVPGGDDAALILEKIRRAMRGRGPAEYEELIRAYFRALSGKVRDEQK